MTGDRYLLRTRVATGGMGEVWRADDTVLDREVAVKVLKQEFADDPVFRARFEAEARHAAALHHDNVASVFDFGRLRATDGSGVGRPFLVMELVPGQPLSELLRAGEPMPPDRAVEMVAQAADGIAAAHALGIVHRDVKPGNLLVTPDGVVKITDFGIARAADGASVTQTGQIVGTPHYISPEQAEGRPATEASDVYALGIVLYECLAGRRPFLRETPIQVALAHVREEVPPLDESVPAWLREVVAAALAKDPARRLGSAAELAAALRGGGLAPAAGAAAATGVPDPEATRVIPPVGAPDSPPTAPADRATTGRRRGAPAWWPWAVAAAAVLGVVLTTAAFAGDDVPAATPEAPSASTGLTEVADEQVRVREADYLGRPFPEVRAELVERGLKVRREQVTSSSLVDAAGTVARVRPRGLVDPGSTVRVGVYDGYVPPPSDDDERDDDEDDDGDKPDHAGGPGKPDKAEKKSKGKAKGRSD